MRGTLAVRLPRCLPIEIENLVSNVRSLESSDWLAEVIAKVVSKTSSGVLRLGPQLRGGARRQPDVVVGWSGLAGLLAVPLLG